MKQTRRWLLRKLRGRLLLPGHAYTTEELHLIWLSVKPPGQLQLFEDRGRSGDEEALGRR